MVDEPKPKAVFKHVAKTPDDHIRDKDNAKPRPTPPLGAKPAPNLAPGGTMGIRRNLVPQTPQKPAQRPVSRPKPREDPEITTGWMEGKITTMPGYSFHAKMYNEPSKHGIGGGKISKLEVRKDDQLVMRYDRGWDKDPQTPQDKEALQRIRTGLGDRPKEPEKVKQPDRSKSIDFDR
jgi:hypothetical protein